MKRERRIWRNGFGAGLLTAGLIVSAVAGAWGLFTSVEMQQMEKAEEIEQMWDAYRKAVEGGE